MNLKLKKEQNKVYNISSLGPYELFGEVELFTQEKRQYHIQCSSVKGYLLSVSKNEFFALFS